MEEPLQAILITELPGVLVDQAVLTTEQERTVWKAAGSALALLQRVSEGEWFGIPCRSGQARQESPEQNPVALVRAALQDWLTQGIDSEIRRC
jgi:hypothetical protein